MSGRHAHPYLAALQQEWVACLDAEIPAAVRLRHELHAHPQVSGEEETTTRRVVEAIAAGPGESVAGTGRLLRMGPSGPAVGVRAELDALPIREQTGAPFAAAGQVMHACGHDVHLAAITALARAASGLSLPVGLVVVLQPREEVGPTGAQDIVAAGALPAHDVRYLIGAHVQPQLPAGAVSADAGPVNAAVDEIEIEIIGRGGHAAYPHLAVDPVPALCRVVLGVQDVVRATIDPLTPVVVTLAQLAGAGAPNVIPSTAVAAGTVRTMSGLDAEALHAAIGRLVDRTAAAHGCRGRYRVRRGEPALVNDGELAHAANGWLDALGQPRGSFASCGSDDFATYGLQLPILMLFVGTAAPRPGSEPEPMLHDPRFLPEDARVRDVALALMAGWLAGAQLLAVRASRAPATSAD